MTDATEKPARRPRADVLRNRDKLLKAAAQVFRKGGPDASLETVAREAGVGIGTLYRHFPTRDALFQGVYEREIGALVALADDLSRAPDPEAAVRQFMHACLQMAATKRGMVRALSPSKDGAAPFYAEQSRRLNEAVSRLWVRGVEAGRLRDDIPVEEVLQGFLGLFYLPEQDGWQQTVTRLTDALMDGMRQVR